MQERDQVATAPLRLYVRRSCCFFVTIQYNPRVPDDDNDLVMKTSDSGRRRSRRCMMFADDDDDDDDGRSEQNDGMVLPPRNVLLGKSVEWHPENRDSVTPLPERTPFFR